LQRVDDILQFITDFTMDIEGVGDVCRLEWIVIIFIFFKLNPLSRNSLDLLYEIFFICNSLDHNNYALLYDTIAVLVSLIFKSMETVVMVHHAIHRPTKGVPKGSWRSHFWGMFMTDIIIVTRLILWSFISVYFLWTCFEPLWSLT
jgi:hypothetical protein